MHRIDVRILDPASRKTRRTTPPRFRWLDLRACVQAPVKIHPGDTMLIPTGIAIHLADPGLAVMILPRSGSVKHGIVLGNLVG